MALFFVRKLLFAFFTKQGFFLEKPITSKFKLVNFFLGFKKNGEILAGFWLFALKRNFPVYKIKELYFLNWLD